VVIGACTEELCDKGVPIRHGPSVGRSEDPDKGRNGPFWVGQGVNGYPATSVTSSATVSGSSVVACS
jgi:hypothetical protein